MAVDLRGDKHGFPVRRKGCWLPTQIGGPLGLGDFPCVKEEKVVKVVSNPQGFYGLTV